MGCLWGFPAVLLHYGRPVLQWHSDPLCFLSPYTLSTRSHHRSSSQSTASPTPSLCAAQFRRAACNRLTCGEMGSFPRLLCGWSYFAMQCSGWIVRDTNEIGSRKAILQLWQVQVSQSWKLMDISTSWQASGLVWSLVSLSLFWLPVSSRKYGPSCFSFLYFVSCSSLDRLLHIRIKGSLAKYYQDNSGCFRFHWYILVDDQAMDLVFLSLFSFLFGKSLDGLGKDIWSFLIQCKWILWWVNNFPPSFALLGYFDE